MGQPDLVAAAVDMVRRALVLTVEISLPLLGIGLVVGLIISVLQAATQVQEQTLAFIPKMFAVVATLFLILPWVMIVLMEYTEDLLLNVHRWFSG
jgi:flagellar biosynthetic protein FliQ